MTGLRKAAEMAIDAMISDDVHKRAVAIVELRQALAQPEQDPVAAVVSWDKSMITQLAEYVAPATLLYTAPPKREWVGLTDEEIDGIYKTHHDQYGKCQTGGFEYERTIEAKLKEKNT